LKVTVLAENTVDVSFMITGEHGLAMFIEDGDERVLFDTGQGLGIINNSSFFGVDLGSTTKIVLSHGHYDHTKGLKPVLDAIGGREIICHPAAFEPKYFKGKRFGQEMEIMIGLPYSREDLEQSGAKITFNKGPHKVTGNITATGEVPLTNGFEGLEKDLSIKVGDVAQPDPFLDDQSLVVKTDKGVSVITGCAHRGLVNTMDYAAKLTGTGEFYAVLGGTHLFASGEERMKKTVEALRKYNTKIIGTCHCTGMKGMARLMTEFKDRFLPFNVGSSVEI
jgi:7,8-dihydropterin-6-yl-methyl-4-(beta-D-ribofuranosyl)aminobenzene 5'-phosphate synthase